jgi:hypothetical protein
VAKNPNFYPVILAGGRGTRFWPLSRKKRAKQLLALDGKQTMIQQTVARLLPLAPPKQFWIVTNDDLRPAILKQLPKLPSAQVLAEPLGRNTAPAIGLAAFLLLRENPDAVIGMFPSDHVIADEDNYRSSIERGVEIAASGENVVVLGVRPNRAETGYGYIEAGALFRGLTPKRLRHLWPREIIFGTAGCFCGAPRLWSMRCASILLSQLPCWKKSLPPLARGNSARLFAGCIPSVKTSASTMRFWNRGRRKASSPVTCFVFLPISAGTI